MKSGRAEKGRGSQRGILIHGGDLILPDRVLPDGAVLVEGRRIAFAGPRAELPAVARRASQRFDAGGGLICPALVELHIHGAGGNSFHNPAEGSLEAVARFLSSRGIGVFLPTMVPHPEYLEAAADQIGRHRPASRIPGIYLEGPFISREKRGGIPEELVRPFAQHDLRDLCEAADERIRVMTFAPEIPGSLDLLADLRGRAILPALGHSSASLPDLRRFELGLEGAENGALLVTHLFNAMTGVSHKDPGLAHWALLRNDLHTELNVDGTHVHPAAVELALRMRPRERTILISDAVVAAGLEENASSAGELYHGPRRAVLRGDGVYYREEGTLIGSRRLVKDVVARCVRDHGIPVWEAVGMASRVPLRMLGLTCKGALEPGMDADISVLDRELGHCSLQVFEGSVLHPLLEKT